MKFIVNQIIPNKTPGDGENEEIACATQYYNTVYTICYLTGVVAINY
jgi:hypothetical protein